MCGCALIGRNLGEEKSSLAHWKGDWICGDMEPQHMLHVSFQIFTSSAWSKCALFIQLLRSSYLYIGCNFGLNPPGKLGGTRLHTHKASFSLRFALRTASQSFFPLSTEIRLLKSQMKVVFSSQTWNDFIRHFLCGLESHLVGSPCDLSFAQRCEVPANSPDGGEQGRISGSTAVK